MSKNKVNLSQAIVRLDDAIYGYFNTEDARPYKNEDGKLLLPRRTKVDINNAELKFLLALRNKLLDIESSTNRKLKVNENFKPQEVGSEQTQVDQLQQVFIEVQRQVDDVLTELAKAIIAQKQITNAAKKPNQLLQINYHLICLNDVFFQLQKFSELVETQKQNRIDTYKFSGFRALFYKLCRHLNTSFIMLHQGADPLYGGQIKGNSTQLSSGECAGKVISWIHQCADKGSPRYPFYAGKNDKHYQETQSQFKSSSRKLLDNISIVDFGDKLFTKLQPGKLYYIAISGQNGGHALGIRIRNDGVYEFMDPNYTHLFSLDKDEMALNLLHLIAHYSISNDYTHASLYEAPVKQNPEHTGYFPDRNTLNKAAQKVPSEAEEVVLVKALERFINDANEKYQDNHSAWLQTRSFNFINSIVLSTLARVNHKSTITKLRELLKKTNYPQNHLFQDYRLSGDLAKKLNDREAFISSNAFKQMRTEQEALIEKHNRTEADLVARMSDIRTEFDKILYADKKEKGRRTEQDHANNQHQLFYLSKQMQQFTGYMVQLASAEIPYNVVARPLVAIKNFAVSVASRFAKGVKKLFSSKKTTESADEPTLLDEITTALTAPVAKPVSPSTSADNKIISQRLSLSKRISLLKEYLIAVESRVALEAKSCDDEHALYYQCLQKYIKDLRGKIKRLHEKVLSDYSGEDQKDQLRQFHDELSAIINLTDNDYSQMEQASQNEKQKLANRLYDTIASHITDEVLAEEQASQKRKHSPLKQDHRTLLSSLQRIIDHFDNIKEAIHHDTKLKLSKPPQSLADIIYQSRIKQRTKHLQKNLDFIIATKNSLIALNLENDDGEAQFVSLASDIRRLFSLVFTERHFSLRADFQASLNQQFYVLPDTPMTEDESARLKEMQSVSEQLRHVKRGLSEKIASIEAKCRNYIMLNHSEAERLPHDPIRIRYSLALANYRNNTTILRIYLARLDNLLQPRKLMAYASENGVAEFKQHCTKQLPGIDVWAFPFKFDYTSFISNEDSAKLFHKLDVNRDSKIISKLMNHVSRWLKTNSIFSEDDQDTQILPADVRKEMNRITIEKIRKARATDSNGLVSIVNIAEHLVPLFPGVIESNSILSHDEMARNLIAYLDDSDEFSTFIEKHSFEIALQLQFRLAYVHDTAIKIAGEIYKRKHNSDIVDEYAVTAACAPYLEKILGIVNTFTNEKIKWKLVDLQHALAIANEEFDVFNLDTLTMDDHAEALIQTKLEELNLFENVAESQSDIIVTTGLSDNDEAEDDFVWDVEDNDDPTVHKLTGIYDVAELVKFMHPVLCQRYESKMHEEPTDRAQLIC